MGDRDEVARQSDVDWLRSAVDDLRTQQRTMADQQRASEQRQAELREADNHRHDAEHDAIDARILAYRERHEADHKAEDRERSLQQQHRGEWTWTRVVAVIGLALTLFGLELQHLAAAK